MPYPEFLITHGKVFAALDRKAYSFQMGVSPKMLASIKEDLAESERCSDYEAVEVLWTAFIKIANEMVDEKEWTRIRTLLDQMSADSMRDLLHRSAVDTLLNLDPPLETELRNPHEGLDARKAARELAIVKRLRGFDPKSAMISLAKILKRIRNKRVHGFKATGVARDEKILGAARPLILDLCCLGLKVVDSPKKG